MEKEGDTATADESRVLEMLQEINKNEGYISRERLSSISSKLGIPLSRLYGLVTFYNQFNLAVSGKYTIEVCEGTACHINKSSEIKRAVNDVAGIRVDETSSDGLFTLRDVRCLGACALAPVLRLNKKIYSKMTYEKTKELILKLKKEAEAEVMQR
jgi:NADH-quinone oxidoreductase subunit E